MCCFGLLEKSFPKKTILRFFIVSLIILFTNCTIFFGSEDDSTNKSYEIVDVYSTGDDGSTEISETTTYLRDIKTGEPVSNVELHEYSDGNTSIVLVVDPKGTYVPQFISTVKSEGDIPKGIKKKGRTRTIGFVENLWCWAKSAIEQDQPVNVDNAGYIPRSWVDSLSSDDWNYRGTMKLSTLSSGLYDELSHFEDTMGTAHDAAEFVIHGIKTIGSGLTAAATVALSALTSWTDGQKEGWYDLYSEMGYNEEDEFDIYTKFLPGDSEIFDGFFTLLVIPRQAPPNYEEPEITQTSDLYVKVVDDQTKNLLNDQAELNVSFTGKGEDSVLVLDRASWICIRHKLPIDMDDVTATLTVKVSDYQDYSYNYNLPKISDEDNSKEIKMVSSESVSSVPVEPSNLTAVVQSAGSIQLNWDDNSNNEGIFKIERKRESTGTYSQVATVDRNVSNYIDTGLSSTTTYYYRVRAYNSIGNSGYSNESYATTEELVVFTVESLNTNLRKDSANPVLESRENEWDSEIRFGDIMYEDDTYHLWYYINYSNNQSPDLHSSHIESINGITWSNGTNNITGLHSDANKVDDVYFQNGTYHLLYLSWMDHTTDYYIRYATSTDGDSWTDEGIALKHNDGTGNTWDQSITYGISDPQWIKNNSTNEFHLLYTGRKPDNTKAIGLATSADGINWTKNLSNPVIQPGTSDSWDSERVSIVDVFETPEGFVAIYSGYNGSVTQQGLAHSTDGITWSKDENNPIVDLTGDTGEWDSQSVFLREVVFRNNRYEIYYSGDNGSEDKFGVAYLE